MNTRRTQQVESVVKIDPRTGNRDQPRPERFGVVRRLGFLANETIEGVTQIGLEALPLPFGTAAKQLLCRIVNSADHNFTHHASLEQDIIICLQNEISPHAAASEAKRERLKTEESDHWYD